MTANGQRGAPGGLLLGLVVLLAGCGDRESADSSATAAPVAVQVATVRRAVLPVTRLLAGNLRPLDRATVAARTAGTVAQADFSLGQVVNAGDVVVRLSAPELQARQDQALASLDQAKRELAREKELAATGASASDALRAATDRVRINEAAWREAVAVLGQTIIPAPFAGVITRKYAYQGDVAHPGAPLFELEARGHLRAELQVPETLPAPGVGSALRIDLGDGFVVGTLEELSPSADPSTHNREARVGLPAGVVARSGQFVRAEWPAGSIEGLVAPAACVGLFGQIERVFVVTAGHAELRLVRPGPASGTEVRILSGLAEGETVIVSPPASLRDGDAVRVIP